MPVLDGKTASEVPQCKENLIMNPDPNLFDYIYILKRAVEIFSLGVKFETE
jgi:hypothetical protein